MKKEKAFTIVEIVIALVILGILVGISVYSYQRFIEKARSAEAILTAGVIRNTEEAHKLDKGVFVAADTTEQINQRLFLDIASKYFEYKVVNVTDDNFLVIAKRIGEEVKAGGLPPDTIVVAMDRTGMVASGYGYTGYAGTAGTTGGGTGGGGGSGGGLGGITSGGGGGSGAGGAAGGSGTGSGDGTGGGGGADDGGHSGIDLTPPSTHDSGINAALALLQSSATGSYYYDLIQEKVISVIYEDFTKYFGPFAVFINAFWIDSHADPAEVAAMGLTLNTIYINEMLKTEMPESAISTIICHEATHADYDYNPQKWIDITLERHPELTEYDLHIDQSPYNSIDQEFTAFVNSVQVWKEVKGSDTDQQMDYLETLYDQGEEELWLAVAQNYGLNDPYDPARAGLPAY